jgi:sulfite reductase (NADPH) flavoprotein alpha-component
VHLTVALVEYDAHGHAHQGGASSFLSTRLDEGGEVNVFVEKNDNFRLPDDGNTPVIMIGPGTGIAPFRAFMQQREAEEASGENWLFFGNPNYTQDFLYQTEWQRFVKDGVVNKVSLAFSRDQEQKIYVQHRMLEQGAEFYQWLERGAHIYVCGDANQMAKDVQDALVHIVIEHGGKSEAQAEQYISDLRRAKRYQKDVY